MNEDYLWDKSGEPDPEVQTLEEILGTLRYQPKPLQLPDDIKPTVKARTSHLPWLAIAAALLIAALAGVIWLNSQKKAPDVKQARVPGPVVPSVSPSPDKKIVPDNKEHLVEDQSPTPSPRKEFAASRRKPRSLEPVPSKEALLAKEQVMAALRLASEKLNLAEKRLQGSTPNQIRNQHKVG